MAESGTSCGLSRAEAAPAAGSSSSSNHNNTGLRDKLAAVLPKNYRFGIHHMSTPPTKTDALCSAPPGERPDRTFCEKHFLAVSIPAADGPTKQTIAAPEHVLVLGVEIFIFTTARSTTLFVSKADSTGYLHRMNLPDRTAAPSPIREVCATFIRYLVEERRRPGVQFVVSLFARAQDQYLFPGSIDHSGKHILDDRGLVKWWCRVLNPLMREPPQVRGAESGAAAAPAWRNARGFLVVPGLDAHEMRAFVPRGGEWALDRDPLKRMSHYTREFDWVPPRCLIPRFPDDPKSRFRDELDSEADRTGAMRKTGSWRSVKTLETFWEMMAFRQECSSGRLTGFIWVVFDDLEEVGEELEIQKGKGTKSDGEKMEEEEGKNAGGEKCGTERGAGMPETPRAQRITNISPTTTPRRLFPRKTGIKDANGTNGIKDTNGTQTKPRGDAEARKPVRGKTRSTPKNKKRRTRLRGVIIPRQPRIKTKQRNYLLDRPVSTAYYFWPPQGRGTRIVDEADYKRILELLLHLDFSTEDKAVSSTGRWVSEGGMGARWGYEVAGMRELLPVQGVVHSAGNQGAAAGVAVGAMTAGAGVPVNNLSGLVKRKRTETVGGKEEAGAAEPGRKVNVLSGGLVRRKRKEE